MMGLLKLEIAEGVASLAVEFNVFCESLSIRFGQIEPRQLKLKTRKEKKLNQPNNNFDQPSTPKQSAPRRTDVRYTYEFI